ncbi:MAG TPA: MlaD family protein [Baekduia sp.]|nr:MlaD family protein [Baekduia sp.]
MRARGRLSLVQWGALTIAVVLVLTYLGATKDVPFVGNPYEIKAAFRDSSGIKKGSPVRVAGVDVGQVTKVERVESLGGRPAAVVTMAVKDNGRPVHSDATAKIRPRIFLEGNFYVDLQPGTAHAGEFDEGAMIPVDRTGNPVQLGEVVRALKSDTRRNLQTTFRELGKTQEAGGGKAFAQSLPDQEVAYRYSAIVAEALMGRRPGDLGRFVRSQAAVSAALDADRRALRDLVTNASRTFGAIAGQEADLRAAINELPRTLEVAMPTLARLNQAFPPLRRFATASLPAVRSTPATVAAVLPLVRQLRGLVGEDELRGLARDLRSATPGLATVSQQGVQVLEELRLLSSCTTEVITPYANSTVPDKEFPATGPVYKEFPKSLVGLAGESRSHDANGPWFKVLGQGGTETVSLGNGLFGTVTTPFRGVQPTPQKTPPPLRPDVPCETQEAPSLASGVGAPPASRRVNYSDPKVQARYEKARDVALELERRRLRAGGSDVKLLDRDATLRDVRAVAAKLGLRGQLDRLMAEKKERGR